MVTFHMAYNPYLLKTGIWIKEKNEWISVTDDSSLDRISKMRIQRWLNEDMSTGRHVFDELCNASGEETIEISFSGTKEDMDDLVKAAEQYMSIKPDIHISIFEYENTNVKENGSKNKLEQLKALLNDIKCSKYGIVLFKRMIDILDNGLQPITSNKIFVNITDWVSQKDALFAADAWRLVFLTFSFDDIANRSLREAIRSFSEEFESMKERDLERERFLLICVCNKAELSDILSSQDKTRKLLLEYGINDLDFFLLNKDELVLIDNKNTPMLSEQFSGAQNAANMYSIRYAEQNRIRKLCDTLQDYLKNEGYIKSSHLFRKVENEVRNLNLSKKVDDDEVYKAYNWVLDFMNKLDNLLNIDGFDSL